jgi:hypothetical protein
MKRVLSFRNISDARVPRVEWDGDWERAFGRPQATGVWFVFGNSGHGKTTFVLMLIKRLAEFGRVHFISYEEGATSASIQDGICRLGLLEVNRRVGIVVETIAELTNRLCKPYPPRFIVIDSLEMSGATSRQIAALAARFPARLFIVIGQAEGKQPASRAGRDLLYVANQKIWVEGYRAISRGRSFGELKHLVIWEKEANVYWNK